MTNTISHSFWESGIWASLSWLVLALSHQDVGRDHLESPEGLSVAGGFAPSLGSLTRLWQESPVSCLKVFRSLQHGSRLPSEQTIKERGEGHIFFLDLALKGKHCHSHYILLFRRESPSPATSKGGRIKLHFQKQWVSKNLQAYFKISLRPSSIDFCILPPRSFTNKFLSSYY